MSMLNDITYSKNATAVQSAYTSAPTASTKPAAPKNETEAAASEAKKPDTDRVEISSTPDISKMSKSERASLVKSLKSDLDNQMSRFTNMMLQTFHKQGINGAMASGDNFWKFVASGNYTVDAKTKEEATQAISENGFWGVSQTSQRIFDFAHAVAGGDVEKMKEMQAAVEKGFKQAGAAWGGSLPSICGETHTAVNNLFDEYYKSHGAAN